MFRRASRPCYGICFWKAELAPPEVHLIPKLSYAEAAELAYFLFEKGD